MSELPELAVDGVIIGLSPETPSTLQVTEGRPAVRRYFPGGAAVYALSVTPTASDAVSAVEEAAGDLLLAYRSRPAYSRTSRPSVAIEGAEEARLLDFQWTDSHGVLMHSVAVVAANSTVTMVLIGAVPELHGPEAVAAVEVVLTASRLEAAGGG